MKNMTWLYIIGFIVILSVAFSIFNLIKEASIRDAERDIDIIQIQHDLGNDLKISLPQSFTQYNNYLQKDSNDFGDWDAVYSFARDAYETIGGTQRPVSIGIRTYKKNTPIPEVAQDGYEFGTFAYYGFTFEKIDDQIMLGKTHNPYPETDSFKVWNLLVYTDVEKSIRVYMYYRDTYLTDEAALRIFKNAVESIAKKE